MIHNTAIRIGIVAAVVLTAWFACWGLGVSLIPPPTDVPKWSFHELPLHIGDWHGEPTKLDDEIAAKTGARLSSIEERMYRDEGGHSIAMHCAMFDDPIPGVYHVPTNCYRKAGWQETDEYRETLVLSDELSIPVLVTTWERESEHGPQHEIVVYWEQLGEHVLFDRADLGFRVRWSLRGLPMWPALLKVMLSLPTNNVEDPKSLILDFAKEVATWENKPEHQTGVYEAAHRAAAGGAAANASP